MSSSELEAGPRLALDNNESAPFDLAVVGNSNNGRNNQNIIRSKNHDDDFVGSSLREEKKDSTLEPTSSSEDIVFVDTTPSSANDMVNGMVGTTTTAQYRFPGEQQQQQLDLSVSTPSSKKEEEDHPHTPAAGGGEGAGASSTLQAGTPTVTPEGSTEGHRSSPSEGEDDEEICNTNNINKNNNSNNKQQLDETLETTKSEVSELAAEHSPSSSTATAASSRDRQQSSSRRHADDDDDSSNDESSYFADPSNLPSPKSARHRFESASVNSLTQLTQNNYNRESDASLSLSDDSDDGTGMAHHQQSLPPPQQLMQPQQQHLQQQPQRVGGVPELYPHPITRIHSASSLVSTSSQYSSDDPNAQDELRGVLSGQQRQSSQSRNTTPTGRRSPVLGHHPPSANMMMMTPSNHNSAQPSPPTIWPMGQDQQQKQQPFDYDYSLQHPQPQHWNEEWARWAASQGYFPPNMPYYNRNNSNESPLSKEGSGSRESTFTYSEDSETAGTPRSNTFFSYVFGDNNGRNNNATQQQQQQSTSSTAAPASSSTKGVARDNSSGRSARGRGDGSGGGFGFQAEPQGGGVASEADKLAVSKKSDGGGGTPDDSGNGAARSRRGNFKVYWQRWIMLIYMSVLNLLSDWTCYSVAPIAVLTKEAFGRINAEQLVVVFLAANAVASACEPIILSRLGLRRTVLFGSLLLMMGSIIKSGGMPPIIQANLEKGQGEWRVYVGFFLVGLSQPLYQCTPALLSASWFPESERTMATGVALNSNQVGIGFAFIFGTLLVSTSDDIPSYFGLLSLLSTLAFLGTLIQFDDAPPTPPSETAKAMRGTLEVNLPSMRSLFESVRNLGNSTGGAATSGNDSGRASKPADKNRSGNSRSSRTSSSSKKDSSGRRSRSSRKDRSSAGASSSSRRSGGATTRRRAAAGSGSTSRGPPNVPGSAGEAKQDFHGLGGVAPSPSPARYGAIGGQYVTGSPTTGPPSSPSFDALAFPAPSPMMPGPVGPTPGAAAVDDKEESESTQQQGDDTPSSSQAEDDPSFAHGQVPPAALNPYPGMLGYPYQVQAPLPPQGVFQAPEGYPAQPNTGMPYGAPPAEGEGGGGIPYGYGYGGPPFQGGYAPPPYQQPVWDPRFQQYVYLAGPVPPHTLLQQQQQQQPPNPYFMSYQNPPPPSYIRDYEQAEKVLPSPTEAIDVGAEPVLTITPHHLDIDIRDDQVLLSIRACMSRPGFIHALVAFTVSGIVINTLSTYMDYLVRLNGAGREYTGIVGGSFQFGIMISSLIVGQFTDKTRAYYSVTVGMLVLGAFALAECGVNLDSDRGVELRWSLVIVAILVGPLQPVSTELGVDVVYPLSENTVLVIQQLFSNLLSAGFIPIFKLFKDIGVRTTEDTREQPEYTFSFYVLIVLHAAATVFVATFNGRYLRFEEELRKKAIEEELDASEAAAAAAAASNNSSNLVSYGTSGVYINAEGEMVHEQQALIPPVV